MLEAAYPHRTHGASQVRELSPLVDAISSSIEKIDAAYYLLEDMYAQVGGSFTQSFTLALVPILLGQLVNLDSRSSLDSGFQGCIFWHGSICGAAASVL